MKLTAGWTNALLIALIPITTVLCILYSDVQSLKINKVDTQEIMQLKVDFTKQMTKNTSAIESLNCTLKDIKGVLHEQQELRNRRRDRQSSQLNNKMSQFKS